MTTALQVYKCYVALKAHFTQNYDIIKYKGHTKNISKETLEKRNDKAFFHVVSKRNDPFEFVLSALLQNNHTSISNTLSEELEQYHQERMKRINSLSYTVEIEIKSLPLGIKLSVCVPGYKSHPRLFIGHLKGNISLETLTVVGKVLDLWDIWEKKLSDDPLIVEKRFQCEKYEPFLKYDRERMFHNLSSSLIHNDPAI